jgi:MFS family permease
LIPQPSEDPKDPLNWSTFKKHSILLIVAFAAFAGDFGSGAGIPPVVLQSKEWKLSPVTVTQANNISIIMAGVSGLLWFPLFSYWGRMPVLFWSSLMGLLFTLGCILAPDFHTFYGLRALQTLTQAVGQTIGLAFIKDIFFYHEHARKIGLWYSIFITAPVMGPLFGNFMIAGLGEWRPVFWLVFAWSSFVLCLCLAFGDESYYIRSVPNQPERGQSQIARLTRILGIWQIKIHADNYFPPLRLCYGRLFEVFFKPVIPLSMFYYAITFMWSVGINVYTSILLETPRSEGGYGFGPKSTGYLYFTPVVAIILGELFGHNFNDWLAARYAKRHGGHFVPEARLWTNYLGVILMILGLILTGQTLQHRLHWVGLVFGWGMAQFGILIISVATVTYVLDCYSNASGEVSALINFGRVGAGFSVGYFQQAWGRKVGFDLSFGVQAVIVGVALSVVVFLQIFGARLRSWAGPVKLNM